MCTYLIPFGSHLQKKTQKDLNTIRVRLFYAKSVGKGLIHPPKISFP